jgi:sulfite exporter TauE/SafE
VIGVLVTTTGIVLLVLGLVGASIEVYGQLLTAIVQQQLFALSEQLPAILRPEVEQPPPGESEPPFGSAYILQKLVENLIGTPLWSALVVAGIVLIYSGLYLAQRQVPGRRARGR